MGDLLHQFGINGTLLLAQIVNFAILVLVLRRFLWGPIQKVLAERRERIQSAELGAASLAERNAAAEAELTVKRAEAQTEASAIIGRAKQRAEEEAQVFLEQARVQAHQIVQHGELAVAKEREALHAEVRSRVVALTIAATKSLLQEEITPERAASAVDASIASAEHAPR